MKRIDGIQLYNLFLRKGTQMQIGDIQAAINRETVKLQRQEAAIEATKALIAMLENEKLRLSKQK